MVMMYHAQEKIVNMPGSEVTGQRGGIHNSVTRAVLKPTHMIGGYAQQILWLQLLRHCRLQPRRVHHHPAHGQGRLAGRHATAHQSRRRRSCHENPRANRDGAEPRQVHRLPHLLRHLQERVDQPRGHRIRVVQQCGDQARHRLSEGLGEPEALERRLDAPTNGKIEPRIGGKWRVLAKIFANPDLPEIDDYYEPFTFDYGHLQTAPEGKAMPTARPRSLITGERMEKIEWGPNWEEILGGEFAKRSQGQQFRRRAEGNLRRRSKIPS